jgi:hypothetical protein
MIQTNDIIAFARSAVMITAGQYRTNAFMISTFCGLVPPVNAKGPFILPTAASPETWGAALSVRNTRGFWAGAPKAAIAMNIRAKHTNMVFIFSSREDHSLRKSECFDQFPSADSRFYTR